MLRRTPTEVKALVPKGERLLSWARTRGEGASYAVATDQALYLPIPHTIRLPWDLVGKATWGDDAVLVVEARLDPRGSDRLMRVRLVDPGAFPTVVYERVTSSVVVSERVLLDGESGVRIVARRAGDGLRWTVTFDPGLDPADPDIRRQADAALAELRSTLGV